MSKLKVVHVPQVKLYAISAQDMQQKLADAWVWQEAKLLDNVLYYPSWEDWDKVFLFLMKGMPAYVAEKRDCDFFAHYLQVMAAYHFGITTLAYVEGWADVGGGIPEYHAWNVFFCGDGFYQLESQRYGSIMDLDLASPYQPQRLVMG